MLTLTFLPVHTMNLLMYVQSSILRTANLLFHALLILYFMHCDYFMHCQSSISCTAIYFVHCQSSTSCTASLLFHALPIISKADVMMPNCPVTLPVAGIQSSEEIPHLTDGLACIFLTLLCGVSPHTGHGSWVSLLLFRCMDLSISEDLPGLTRQIPLQFVPQVSMVCARLPKGECHAHSELDRLPSP